MKEIKELLNITKSLKEKYKKSFTLDGKLVGDIGEVLCSIEYGIELYAENQPIHDGMEIATGREVQIKSSFNNYSYFPYGESKLPAYFLSINITPDGEIVELFNGPGSYILENYIKARKLKAYKKTYYRLSKGILMDLNNKVP
ncbi:MAG: DUF6998 domain-containing protein [Lutibacter sp.]